MILGPATGVSATAARPLLRGCYACALVFTIWETRNLDCWILVKNVKSGFSSTRTNRLEQHKVSRSRVKRKVRGVEAHPVYVENPSIGEGENPRWWTCGQKSHYDEEKIQQWMRKTLTSSGCYNVRNITSLFSLFSVGFFARVWVGESRSKGPSSILDVGSADMAAQAHDLQMGLSTRPGGQALGNEPTV
ncbi:hypothetical protein Nepgr_019908 [Nepenthes gracilis]|uniref:Uncharacterized protein n=1 Tax=Nepenthes gracilis TaxID=150966 RepID=A0AAD3SW48_NEPGR|nr:hypothetical protein Nepgr_019908 [Nepenthes gracilis]